MKQKNWDKAQENFLKASNLNPSSDKLYGILATIYEEQGELKLSRHYFHKAQNLRSKQYNATTKMNYEKIKEILSQREIPLMAAQYPMRSVENLKALFDDPGGIIFVDNEKIFKDAVRKDGYNEYFFDNFGGDFGHTTVKGNQLLANHIAQIIVKEVLKSEFHEVEED